MHRHAPTRLLAGALCAALTLGLPATALARASVPVNKDTFPDDVFRSYVLEKIDTNHDGVLSDGEASRSTAVNVPNMGIRDLTGIRYLTSLGSLDCSGNELTSLDLHAVGKDDLAEAQTAKDAADADVVAKENALADAKAAQAQAEEDLAEAQAKYDEAKHIKDFYDENGYYEDYVTFVLNDGSYSSTDYDEFIDYMAEHLDGCGSWHVVGHYMDPEDIENGYSEAQGQLTEAQAAKDAADADVAAKQEALDAATKAVADAATALAAASVPGCPELVVLVCDNNKLSSIDAGGCSKLLNVWCTDNRLGELNLSDAADLRALCYAGNPLVALRVSDGATSLLVSDPGKNSSPESIKGMVSTSGANTTVTVDLHQIADVLGAPDFDVSRVTVGEGWTLDAKTWVATHAAQGAAPGAIDYVYDAGAGKSLSVSVPLELTLAANSWSRVFGKNAYDTMQKCVRADGVFADGRGGTVIVATGDGYWDALAASGLAGCEDAPIVTTPSKKLGKQAQEELQRLKPTKVVVMGGTFAVSDAAYQQIRQACPGAEVGRVFGSKADDTAVAAYEAGSGWGDTCVVATVDGYWDALSIAPYAYARKAPIFLTNMGTKQLSPATLEAIEKGGFKHVVIVGGTGAVPAAVERQLKGFKVTRLYGKSAIDTSAKIAEWEIDEQGMTTDHMAVATGQGYWDALAGAPLVGRQNSVLVLVNENRYQAIDAVYKADEPKVASGYVLGGAMAVSDKTWEHLHQ